MFRTPRLCIVSLSLFLFCLSGLVSAAPEKIILEPSPDPVALRLLTENADGCEVLFELNQLTRQSITIEGETFQALTITKGGLSGLDGQPGLPTFSGMLAVPEGFSVSLQIISTEEKEISGMQVFPVQPDQVKSYTVDLGEPAIYLGQAVVPFTVHPVQYQASLGIISVATRLRLSFEFVAGGKGLSSRRAFHTVPQSFSRLFDDVLVNSVSSAKSASPDMGPGTYLVITPAIAQNSITSLLNWRKRQGYNVLVASTEEIGASFSNIKNYIQNIYDTVEPPLEYVLLIGDANGTITCPTGTEYVSGWNGETDHYYTTLDGNDMLSDIHIGRLTVRDNTQLLRIVNKIVTYETNPPMSHDPDWFTRATVVGDPDDSGITTIYVNQWLKAQLEDQAYTQVDTIFGGNFPALMHDSLNQGVSIFGYRGFYAMSGYSPGFIALLQNGNKMPFAVLPTCDTGSFRAHITAHSEAFLRAPGGGAIGAIALSTSGTHTRYNNCLYHGIWEGMLNTDDHHMGSALTRGKLELYNNYFLSEPESAEIWTTWANLMGDPATDIWLDLPTTLDATHPTFLPVSANSVAVTVTSEGSPVEGVLVAIFKEPDVRGTGYTDAQGVAILPFSAENVGTAMITTTMHNRLPYRGSLYLGPVDVFAGLSEVEFSGGNNDGLINSGELLGLRCSLESLGINLAAGVSATLISRDSLVSVLDSEEYFGDIPAGEFAWCQESFQIHISDQAKDQHLCQMELVANNGIEQWVSSFSFTVQAPEFVVNETNWSGQQGYLSPGDFGDLVLDLSNVGSLSASATSAVLSTESPWILITDENGAFGPLDPGDVSNNSFNRFSLQTSSQCFSGYLATFELRLTLEDGLVRTTTFQMNVGQTSSTDPVGPDAGGYYAFDNTDTDYEQAPVYTWIELNPTLGGPGTSVGLTDFAFQQDDTRTLDLPFSFQYYGQSFDKISICSNGWVAMGETSLRHYRNFTIPSAGSPNAMIAPFWDNLDQSGSNLVYYWQDEANGLFVVQWSNVQNHYNQTQNFELILRDPAMHPTGNGDGEFVFQYDTVNNNDYENGFATVGIQNLTGDGGLLYTYWNQYATGAAPLESGRAILFTPTPVVPTPTCDVSPAQFDLVMAPDQVQQQSLVIANNGQQNSQLFYIIEKTDPDAPVQSDSSKNMEGSTMTASISVYPIGEIAEVVFSVTNNSPDNEYLDSVSLNFPLGVNVLSGTNLVNSGIQYLTFNQATGDGANCYWDGGFVTAGNTATCTMVLDFSTAAGAVMLPYTIAGDNYGGDPHSVAGTIVLTPSGASISLLSPNGGELWVVDEEATVSFLAGGGTGLLTLDLDRGDGNGWQTIVQDIPSSDTSVNWLVEGPISGQCLMRLQDNIDPEIFDESDAWFTIGRNMSWVSLDQTTGTIGAGLSDEIILTFNTEGLQPGLYAVDLVIRQMATGALVVPVRLEISGDVSGQTELPRVTRLDQNHPNPFNPQTEISFSVKSDGFVKLKVYNAQGRLVRTLVDGHFVQGEHRVTWRGIDDAGHRLSSGMYLYRMETGSGVEVRKMSLVK